MKDDLYHPRPADRLAVLVDGENITHRHAATILAQARHEGRTDLRRVYGDAARLKGWEAEPGYRLMHSGTGKNATDLLLTVDAMELALAGGCDAVLIASSDRDFTHLAHRLRERGLRVIGMGEDKAAAQFRAACSLFHVLPPAQPASEPPNATKADAAAPCQRQHITPKTKATAGRTDAATAHVTAPRATPPSAAKITGAQPSATPSRLPITQLDRTIRDLILHHGAKGAALALQQLGALLHRDHQQRATINGHPTWRSYLKDRPDLFALSTIGDEICVCSLPAGFGAQAATASQRP